MYRCFKFNVTESDFFDLLPAVKATWKRIGMDKKYEPEYIMGLISHANLLMEGKGENEKKDFYLSSISSILDTSKEKMYEKSECER